MKKFFEWLDQVTTGGLPNSGEKIYVHRKDGTRFRSDYLGSAPRGVFKFSLLLVIAWILSHVLFASGCNSWLVKHYTTDATVGDLMIEYQPDGELRIKYIDVDGGYWSLHEGESNGNIVLDPHVSPATATITYCSGGKGWIVE
jgi:hypothetical protein